MTRYRITIAYEGTAFHGWQRQEPPDGTPVRTVQGELEATLRQVLRQPITLRGASRTDAGVHAAAQTAVFDADLPLPEDRFVPAVNSRLPDDLQVLDLRPTSPEFDPIGDCVSKGYRYWIRHAGNRGLAARPPLFARCFLYWTPVGLDVPAMTEAASDFTGTHDFASCTRLHHGRESTVRTVHACTITPLDDVHCVLDIAGEGFLYNMVRIIAGTLVEIGRGRTAPAAVPDILAARDRRAAGPTLPPEGLWLMWIRYRGEPEITPPPGDWSVVRRVL